MLRSKLCWAAFVVLVVFAVDFAIPPPKRPDNLCAIFQEKVSWYQAAKRARSNWGLPVPMGMAFIHRESSFRSDARPERQRLFGVVPWLRPSDAFGYAQATDAAWSDYKKATGALFPERDDFKDALDFIGWYNDRSHRQLGIAKTDAYRLYLAYYSGLTGYAERVWRREPAVLSYARKAADRTARYRGQLNG
ncbi:MAG: hypothetical protein OXH37_12205, partial [Gammaproteobacteria bacterium]|nr:hypothetical protein [Gammaproteobacteria bacterium]